MTRTERRYGALLAAYNMSWAFIAPVYPLFLREAGLDLLQINVVLATYFITSFCFEVPTGAVADVFGRRVSFLASCAVRASAFTLYYFADGFAVFLVAEAVDAVGQTLASGALDAWAVDAARREQPPVRTDRLLARGFGIGTVAMIASGVAGGLIGEIDLRVVWLAGAAGFVVTGLLAAATMRESWSASARSVGVHGRLWGGVGTVWTRPLLFALTCLTAASGFAQMPFLHYWPVRLTDDVGVPVWLVGWAWAGVAGVSLVGSQLGPRSVAMWGRGRVSAGAELLRAVAVGVAARSLGLRATLVGGAGQAFGMGAMMPLVSAWVNDHVEESERATVLSVNAAAFTLGSALGLVGLGLVARSSGIGAAWGISALVFLGCAVGYLRADAQSPGSSGGNVRGRLSGSTQSVPSAQ